MTQKAQVIQWLEQYGEVTRNQALSHRITRLGAIVCVLKNEGYEIEGKWRGNDYVYELINRPVKPSLPKFEPRCINGVWMAVQTNSQ